MTQAQFNFDFRGFLTVWSNVTGVIGPTGNVADRTYALVLEQPWMIRATYSVAAGGAGTAVGTPTVTMNAATTHNPAVPITGTAIVMVGPSGLGLIVIDAQQ